MSIRLLISISGVGARDDFHARRDAGEAEYSGRAGGGSAAGKGDGRFCGERLVPGQSFAYVISARSGT